MYAKKFYLCTMMFLMIGSLQARNLTKLDILKDNYPRAFFFRAAEGAHAEKRYPTYESWEQQFSRLQGIIGKCLDEECLGRETRNPEFFSRFKHDHPHQVVLLHFNGNARDPRYCTEPYFSGHWIYRKAIEITEDILAKPGTTVIHVADTQTFRVNTGRYRSSNDDIALFGVTAQGTHDWYHCEQVQLVAVDPGAKTITVKRGCYGTQPRAFCAGRARAAVHMVEGPWGKNNHLMWFYNFTTHCPRDRNGKTCADLLVEDLSRWFGPQGKLTTFDGLEFDVMHHKTRGDTNGDGFEDNGIIEGVNTYGIGMFEFARKLRQRLTDNFIIQGDGALGPGGLHSQRAWSILNGIESEGFPNLNEWEFEDWSGGLNRHFFWRDNAREPVFNYVNHKWNEAVPGQPGVRINPHVPFARHRLVLAACQFFDAMTCYSFAPRNDPDGRYGVWDELRCGIQNQTGWLGKPEGPAVRLARQTPDLLHRQGQGHSLTKMISGPVTIQTTAQGVVVSPNDPNTTDIRFKLLGLPTQGTDLVVFLNMTGNPRKGYPPEMARFGEVSVSGGQIDLMAGKLLEIGMKLRGAKSEVPLDSSLGAVFQERAFKIGDTLLPAFFVHPPYRKTKGYTYWIQEAVVLPDSELHFSIGMGALSPQRSDGVRFEVHVAEVSEGITGPYIRVFTHITNQHQWLPQVVSLKRFSGKCVRLKFVVDCGSHDNATTDHAYWGAVKMIRSGITEMHITPTVKIMTWVNQKPFDSSFYYRDIRSDIVDLSVVVEGKENVTLRSITAHAHADAIYRVFERGLVLANPAHRPYTFDLTTISPERCYRRLQAVKTQDTITNNGQPVQGKVTLEERDALFLVRQ